MSRAALQSKWYSDRPPGLALRLLEPFYLLAYTASQRLGAARRCIDLEGRPLIVVGNITVGGTGKTPLVIRLCELLREAGLAAGVVSRGYGRSSKERVWVTAGSDPRRAGDEPLLIARRCGVPVIVDAEREAAALTLFRDGVDVVIADDGLQRAQLPRTLELCVVDASRGLGNGHLLPAGPLREPVTRLEQVDYVIRNGRASAKRLPVESIPMHLEPQPYCNLESGALLDHREMVEHCRDRLVHAVAGIGSPRRFFDLLDELGLRAHSHHPFADHHPFGAADFAALRGTIVMTEKDAVKCRGLGLRDAWYLPVRAVLPAEWERKFVARIRTQVRELA